MKFPGRVLFLCMDPQKITKQLENKPMSLAEALPLRDDISTDEITPISSLIHFDDQLAQYAHTGFETMGENPIYVGALASGDFSVIVAGKRYGKGSSREHSPLSERRAGVTLIIAESFERLYQQNADNLGLFTSTDFSLLDRIFAGEDIPIDDLLKGRDKQTSDILRAGGLIEYGRTLDINVNAVGNLASLSHVPMTYVEKIILQHMLQFHDQQEKIFPGMPVFVKPAWRYFHDIYTAMCGQLLHDAFGSNLSLHQPETIISFEDHYSYAHRPEVNFTEDRLLGIGRMSSGHRRFVQENRLKDYGYLEQEEGSEGISHAVMTETHILPGQLAVGTDSHTPHCGALGAFAYGVGSTEISNALVTGFTRLKIPEVIRVDLQGYLPCGVMAKDIVLHILADPFIQDGGGIGKVFEFSGPVAETLGTDERATLTNMTAEMGGLTGVFIPDDETAKFLWERRGIKFKPEAWMCSDPGAKVKKTLVVECDKISPMLASPGDPGHGLPILSIKIPIAIHIAYGGSCTAGKREDFDAYHLVLAWAAEKGLKVSNSTTFFLQFGSMAVRKYCEEKGYLNTFHAVGAKILNPACGACAGCGPGLSVASEQVTISAINRNFPGRSGPGKVWLASPMTVAASAISGNIVSFEQLRELYQ
ncbi:MAG: aconitase family protein [Alphaproteobacteria bacterium]